MKTYTVRAYRSQDTVDQGSDYDRTCDTLKEAKEAARYSVTEEFRRLGEMSEVFGYALVENADGENVFDCFAKPSAHLARG